VISRMRGFRRKVVLAIGIAVAALSFAAVAGAGSSFPNGGFETGDFSFWNVQSTGSGNWFVSDKIITPLNGYGWRGPVEHEFAAVTDDTNPGTHVLYRFLSLGAKRAKLSLWLYYKNHGSGFCDAGTLDYTTVSCNQQIRVDILQPAASPTSVNPADVLIPIFHTKDSSSKSQKPKNFTVNLKSLSGTVMLRIAEVDNQGTINAAVDNVQLNFGG